MTRGRLQEINKKRKTFIARFERYGIKQCYDGSTQRTILLRGILDSNNNILADHVWFICGKQFRKIGLLIKGDTIQFDARVKQYFKGYRGRKTEIIIEKPIVKDYKLSNPTNIKKIIPHRNQTKILDEYL